MYSVSFTIVCVCVCVCVCLLCFLSLANFTQTQILPFQIYWCAPISGGIIAALLYEFIFSLKRLNGQNMEAEIQGSIVLNSVSNKALTEL